MKALLTFLFILLALIVASSDAFAQPDTTEEAMAEFIAEFESSLAIMSETLTESVEETKDEMFGYTMHIGGWSHHLNPNKYDFEYNESHEMLAIEYQNWVVGTFINSFYDRTWLVGYNFKKDLTDEIQVGAMLALSYGYDEEDVAEEKLALNHKGFMPIGYFHASYLAYQDKDIKVRPTFGLMGSALVLMVQLEF